MKVTREMIGAAHDILLKKEMVLSADLLADIYMAMASRNSETESLRQQLATAQDALENEQAKGIHSCYANCTMDGCVNRKLREQLAAALAAIKVKDEALENCEGMLDELRDYPVTYDLIIEALAIQPDDSALQAFAEKVREQCAQVIEDWDSDSIDPREAADAIRNLKELPK